MSWSTVSLGEAVAFRGGGTPSRGNPSYWGGSIPWATVKDLNSGYALRTTQEFITEEGLQRSASNLIPAGTVIIPTRMALGKAVMSEVDVAINQDLKAAIPIKELDTRFLLWFFLANSSRIEAMGKGATVKGVTLDQLRSLEIPLPPIAEQRRIAAILDKADALRAKRREAIAKLDQLLQSVFLDMFGDPVFNNEQWEKKSLSSLCVSPDDIRCGPFGTQLAKSEFTSSGIPLWGIKHVNRDFRVSTAEFVSESTAKRLGNYTIQAGDIVMTRKGTIGNCAIYPKSCSPGIMHSDLLRVRVSAERCNPEFLVHQLHYSRDVEAQLDLISGGAIMQGINVTKLKDLEVIVPPVALQERFGSAAEKIEAHKNSLLRHAEHQNVLFSSLQHRAFSGTL